MLKLSWFRSKTANAAAAIPTHQRPLKPLTQQKTEAFSYPAIFRNEGTKHAYSVILRSQVCEGCNAQTLLGVKGTVALLECMKGKCGNRLLRIETNN